MKQTCILLLISLQMSSCGTGQKRVLTGAGFGVAIGAAGGAAFSPNSESRALNALVFGLSGAIVGAIMGVLTDTSPSAGDSNRTLKDRDASNLDDEKLYEVEASKELPPFLKNRIKPIIIEQFTHQDSVDEDGSLHEPHKVYRIKRNGELFSRPIQNGNSKK